MTPDRLSDLASRLGEEGSLSPEEERELGLLLRESPEARRLVLSYFRLEGALVEHARAGLVSAPLASRPAPSLRGSAPRTSAWGPWAAALAAAGLFLALLFLARPSSPPPTRISRVDDARPEASPSVESPRPAVPPVAPPDAVAERSRVPAAPVGELRPPRFPEPAPPAPVAPAPEPLPEPVFAAETPRTPEAVVTEVLIERAEGDVFVSGGGPRVPGRAGDPIRPGQSLETGPGKSLAVLAFPDGSRLEARPETLLRDIREKGGPAAAAGKSLTLQRGILWAQVRPQPADRPLVVLSPRGEARVLGTIFTMRVEPDSKGALRLDVQEGKVRFTRSSDNRSVDVAAGHSVSSGPGSDLVLLRSQEVVQSFQDGRFPSADYAGTRDTTLAEKNPQSNFGGSRTLVAEPEEPHEKRKASWALLRWDVSSIPPGSVVHSVSVTLHILEPSRGQPYYFFEPARSWTESEASWKFASSGNLWRFPGSLGSVERWSAPLGTLAPLQKGEYTAILGDAGVALVQSWVTAPAGNLGLLVACAGPAPGVRFSSREASPPEARPRLTVVYGPRK